MRCLNCASRHPQCRMFRFPDNLDSDPNALQAMRGLRMITMSQFIDDRSEKFDYEKDDDKACC